jgi:uncharacterized membrane protein YedE/YeeE
VKAVACLLGVVFGVTLCWTGMSDPDVIRGALTFQSAYLYLFFASAVGVAAVGLYVLRRARGTEWVRERPQRRHVRGALLFGLGWGVTGACPGPIATQIGQGILWALPLMAGVVLGVRLFLRQGAAETEPARDLISSAAARRPRRRPGPTATDAGPR